MSKRTRDILLTFALIGTLISCSSGPDPEQIALEKALSIIPLPNNDLIESRSGVSQGSQDECYAGYAEMLYGTDIPESQVLVFYRKYAVDNHWIIDEDYSDTFHLGAKSPDESYYLGVVVLIPRGSSVELYPSRIHPKVIDEALSQYKTVYLFSISYSEPGRCI